MRSIAIYAIFILLGLIVGALLAPISSDEMAEKQALTDRRNAQSIADCELGDNGFGSWGDPILPDSEVNRDYLEHKCQERHSYAYNDPWPNWLRSTLGGLAGVAVGYVIAAIIVEVIRKSRNGPGETQ